MSLVFPPKTPPATVDTAALVELIRSPQKAAELWGQYEAARAAYEAQKAANAAERAELDKKSQDVLDASAQLVAEIDKFKQEQIKWEVVKKDALEYAKVRAEELQKQATDLQEKETKLISCEQGLKDFEARLKLREKELDKLQLEQLSFYTEQSKKLESREAAVAEREKKAEELAKLFKDF